MVKVFSDEPTPQTGWIGRLSPQNYTTANTYKKTSFASLLGYPLSPVTASNNTLKGCQINAQNNDPALLTLLAKEIVSPIVIDSTLTTCIRQFNETLNVYAIAYNDNQIALINYYLTRANLNGLIDYYENVYYEYPGGYYVDPSANVVNVGGAAYSCSGAGGGSTCCGYAGSGNSDAVTQQCCVCDYASPRCVKPSQSRDGISCLSTPCNGSCNVASRLSSNQVTNTYVPQFKDALNKLAPPPLADYTFNSACTFCPVSNLINLGNASSAQNLLQQNSVNCQAIIGSLGNPDQPPVLPPEIDSVTTQPVRKDSSFPSFKNQIITSSVVLSTAVILGVTNIIVSS